MGAANAIPPLYPTSRIFHTKALIPQKSSLSPPSRSLLLVLRAVNGNDATPPPPPSETPQIPPRAVEIRFRRGSRRRSRQQEPENFTPKPPPPPKDWDSMTIGEKAVELYVGEKGLLFWLNKFAYASIFIIIGGWILFRFVGPSIGLYQLDGAPQPPTSLFKSS
ncbi:hypothetical protein H6P81_018820 [Aristolochia fimbriata]|uniref:Uncharacterized protein n=1 Tax=Aristolochia fimbriata TaxID=158543 RepID=A0AAV7E596_ARIFI|nr:hypothetical protein H6P81_018820 [Aristolochia fimbriata]